MSFIKNLFSSPSPPAAPNPAALAAAQGAANAETARLQGRMNRMDTYTPFGSVTYSDLGDDRYSITQTLSPEQQGLYDQNVAIGKGMLGLAQGAIGNFPTDAFTLEGAPAYQTGIDYSGLEAIPGAGDFGAASQAASDAAFNRVMNRLNPQFDQQREALQTQLANQGIALGSEAYTTAMDDFGRRRSDAGIAAGYDAIAAGEAMRQGLFANALQTRGQQLGERTFDMNAINQARQNYLNEQVMSRNQQINELAALLQGQGAIQSPTMMTGPQTGVAPTDVTGAYSLAAGIDANNYNQQMGMQQAGIGALADLGGAAIAQYSDRRLKKNIQKIANWKGFDVYCYNYIWGGETQIGVMAQDVLERIPEAVVQVGDWLAVDYGKLWRAA